MIPDRVDPFAQPLTGGRHTYTRQVRPGEHVEITRAPVAQHTARIRELAAADNNDAQIGAALGLSAAQVAGLRRRAKPPIPAAIPRGRPLGSLDRYPRLTDRRVGVHGRAGRG